ncbi:ABC transporter ATP-binding protein [Arachnia propionica]|jgi:ABC transporter related|uniref:Daunorubicin/doxorubicin resistance ATP-binding protein DrrA n=1 Tax=Arachnia propionica TaxID=1750 RepID=A0A3S4U3A6_9ACTN|nr:ABC transporter ATP-binding protein [Arachnia propionica]VEH68753.1 Daunorubicin/doxorubicin resistance ATP-binding protein DrrA [Arachnia propionica]
MKKVVVADNVTRTYGKFTAVDGVSFHVAQGELVALLGSNGAGKTSLLEVLQGSTRSNDGRVRVFGVDPVADRAAIRQRTGIMLQEAGFAKDLTVRETLVMWAGTLTSPRPVADSLAMCGLEGRADIRVGSLSGGERRRLDLAMATLGRPELLFMDEPTTGLDPAVRQYTWELVRRMLDEGSTVLLTTHYMEEAEELADRILIMDRGRILTEGSVADIVARHPCEITFRDVEVSDGEFERLSHVVYPVSRDRGITRVLSTDLHATLRELLALADSRDIHLDGLNARAASLESAFLHITSRSHS